MKKILPFLLLLILIAAAVFYLKKGDESPAPEGGDGSPSETMLYGVRVDIRERKSGHDVPVLLLNGALKQYEQAPLEYVSQWTAIDELTVLGQTISGSARDGMIGKNSLSSYDNAERDYIHYIPEDFPAQMLPFQLGFLRKIFLPLTLDQLKEGSFSRNESDEAGAYKVEYTIRATANGFEVDRVWQQYVAPGVKVDASENAMHFVLSKAGQLEALNGRLTLHYHQPEAHYSTEIQIQKKGSEAKASKALVQKEQLKKTDSRSIAQSANDDPNLISFKEAMNRLDAISDKSDSKEVYLLFSSLKAEVIKDPSHAREIFDRINATSARDASSKRRLTILFGALAQSEATEIAENLANEVQLCPDSFCKIQSIVGVSDHPNPSEATAEKMLDIARQTSDDEIAGTALLAAGSIGRKLDASLPDLPKALLQELNDPEKAEIKGTILAAMGNHGNPEYLQALEGYAKSNPDPSLQASAVYSLRYLPQESVNQTLLSVLSESKNKTVMSEAFKAIEYRNLSQDQYQSLAKTSAALSDKDLAQSAARVLLEAYRDDPKLSAPLDTMREGTKFPEVRDYLNGELKRMEEEQKDPNAAP